MTEKNPVVLISYSHDTPAHLDRVLSLSNKLRADGIDCILDQYEESPSEGWPRWMEKNIRIADFVLLVCTETYFNRVMGLEKDGIGLGAKWEGHLIYQHLYNEGAINNRFIPIIFSDGSNAFVPTPIQSATIYNVDNSSEFDKLYWRLRGLIKSKPELGKLKAVPEKERKTLFVGGFIDVELWNKAGWKGVVYAHDQANREPPVVAILFTNEDAARKIFEGWRKRLGEYDKYNELRISIVEGDVEDEPYGYYIHISSYLENIIKHLKESNPNEQFDLFMLVSRIHRMNPEPTSQNLILFKKRFALFNSYTLIPGIIYNDNKIKLIEELRILKRNIELRNYADITSKNDPDSVLNKKFIKEVEDKK